MTGDRTYERCKNHSTQLRITFAHLHRILVRRSEHESGIPEQMTEEGTELEKVPQLKETITSDDRREPCEGDRPLQTCGAEGKCSGLPLDCPGSPLPLPSPLPAILPLPLPRFGFFSADTPLTKSCTLPELALHPRLIHELTTSTLSKGLWYKLIYYGQCAASHNTHCVANLWPRSTLNE